MKRNISERAFRRIPRYFRHLEQMQQNGTTRLSSEMLARQTGLTASQIRHDLSSFGDFGHQGYGYNIKTLKHNLASVLGMHNEYSAVILGAGRMGLALAHNFPFEKYGIALESFFDVDPYLIGTTIERLPVYSVEELRQRLMEKPVDIAVLTTPAAPARELAEILAECGVRGIWNFTDQELNVKSGNPIIENVHLFDSLFSMCSMMNLEQVDAQQVDA